MYPERLITAMQILKVTPAAEELIKATFIQISVNDVNPHIFWDEDEGYVEIDSYGGTIRIYPDTSFPHHREIAKND